MGVYIANEVTIQSPPQTLRIKCHAADLKKSLKIKGVAPDHFR